MDEYNAGNALLIDDEIDDAIKKYSDGLSLRPDFAKLYSHRALAYIKCGKYTLALQDCNRALAIDPNDHITMYRKGLICFELGEIEIATKFCESAMKALSLLDNNSNNFILNYQRLLRKCHLQLSVEENYETNENNQLFNAVPANVVKQPTQVSTKELLKEPTNEVSKEPIKESDEITKSSSKIYLETTKYYYSDEDSQIIITIQAAISSDQLNISILEDHLRVEIQWMDKLEIVLDKELYDVIDVSISKYVIKKNKINIYLKKKDKRSWPSLEYSGEPRNKTNKANEVNNDKILTDATKADISNISNPPNEKLEKSPAIPKAYSSKRDWERIGSEIVKEAENEPEDPLKKLFSDIYAKADPDTRRAMNKSFQTSGGTVLSTNWNEVQKADYEKQKKAPKGMEWRSWEGDKVDQIESDDDK